MVSAEVEPEAFLRDSVAVVTAALLLRAVVVVPRTGARLLETGAHLFFVLGDAALVDATVGGAVRFDPAVIGAAKGRLRPRLTRRRVASFLMLLASGLLCLLLTTGLLMLFLRRLLATGLRLLLLGCLLMLLALLMFLPGLPSSFVPLFLLLCVSNRRACQKQEQNCGADDLSHFHMRYLQCGWCKCTCATVARCRSVGREDSGR